MPFAKAPRVVLEPEAAALVAATPKTTMTRAQLADAMKVSDRTLARMVKTGAIQAAVKGGHGKPSLYTAASIKEERTVTTRSRNVNFDAVERIAIELEQKAHLAFERGECPTRVARDLGVQFCQAQATFREWCMGGGLVARAMALWETPREERVVDTVAFDQHDFTFRGLLLQGVAPEIARKLVREIQAGVDKNPEPVGLEERLAIEKALRP